MSRDVGEKERWFSRKRRKSLNFDDRIVYYFQSSNLKSFVSYTVELSYTWRFIILMYTFFFL
jgi:hypothetical protein